MRPLSLAVSLSLLSCVGTTGGDVIDFAVAASGPSDASPGQPLVFDTDRGWHVTLTRATLHIGALYLSQSQPVAGAQTTSCILPGTYVAQVTTGLDIDLLSPLQQRFPTLGHGTTLPAAVGQVWLTGGPVDTASDATPILIIAGTAQQASDVRPFTGTITISTNRVSTGGTSAGSDTICKQRIVTPIATPDVTITHDGGLALRIDPRLLFVNVDFGALTRMASPGNYAFGDDPAVADQASSNLYQNLHSGGALYSFHWDSTLR